MKKVSLLFSAVFFLLSMYANAQSKTGADYFAGKWNVLVKGTPDGDHRMVFVLDKKDTTLIGVVQDTAGKEIAKIDKIDIADKTAKVYFNASGYDVNVEINQKDDDHVTGNLMGMFNAEGERIKATK
jgi:hypothetical protein